MRQPRCTSKRVRSAARDCRQGRDAGVRQRAIGSRVAPASVREGRRRAGAAAPTLISKLRRLRDLAHRLARALLRRPVDTRNGVRPGVQLCPAACPIGPELPMAKPNRTGIMIRVSGVRVPSSGIEKGHGVREFSDVRVAWHTSPTAAGTRGPHGRVGSRSARRAGRAFGRCSVHRPRRSSAL